MANIVTSTLSAVATKASTSMQYSKTIGLKALQTIHHVAEQTFHPLARATRTLGSSLHRQIQGPIVWRETEYQPLITLKSPPASAGVLLEQLQQKIHEALPCDTTELDPAQRPEESGSAFAAQQRRTNRAIEQMALHSAKYATFAMLGWAAGHVITHDDCCKMTQETLTSRAPSCWDVFKKENFKDLSRLQQLRAALSYFFFCYATGLIENGIHSAAHALLLEMRSLSGKKEAPETLNQVTRNFIQNLDALLFNYSEAHTEVATATTADLLPGGLEEHRDRAIKKTVQQDFTHISTELAQLIFDRFTFTIPLFQQWRNPHTHWPMRYFAHMLASLTTPLVNAITRHMLKTIIIPHLIHQIATQNTSISNQISIAQFFKTKLDDFLATIAPTNAPQQTISHTIKIPYTNTLRSVAGKLLFLLKWEDVSNDMPDRTQRMQKIDSLNQEPYAQETQDGLMNALVQIATYTINYLNDPKHMEELCEELASAMCRNYLPSNGNPTLALEEAEQELTDTADTLFQKITSTYMDRLPTIPDQFIRKELDPMFKSIRECRPVQECDVILKNRLMQLDENPHSSLLSSTNFSTIRNTLSSWIDQIKRFIPAPDKMDAPAMTNLARMCDSFCSQFESFLTHMERLYTEEKKWNPITAEISKLKNIQLRLTNKTIQIADLSSLENATKLQNAFHKKKILLNQLQSITSIKKSLRDFTTTLHDNSTAGVFYRWWAKRRLCVLIPQHIPNPNMYLEKINNAKTIIDLSEIKNDLVLRQFILGLKKTRVDTRIKRLSPALNETLQTKIDTLTKNQIERHTLLKETLRNAINELIHLQTYIETMQLIPQRRLDRHNTLHVAGAIGAVTIGGISTLATHYFSDSLPTLFGICATTLLTGGWVGRKKIYNELNYIENQVIQDRIGKAFKQLRAFANQTKTRRALSALMLKTIIEQLRPQNT